MNGKCENTVLWYERPKSLLNRETWFNKKAIFLVIIVIDFWGTTKAVKLELGTHMDNGLMCRVYQNQGQGPIIL